MEAHAVASFLLLTVLICSIYPTINAIVFAKKWRATVKTVSTLPTQSSHLVQASIQMRKISKVESVLSSQLNILEDIPGPIGVHTQLEVKIPTGYQILTMDDKFGISGSNFCVLDKFKNFVEAFHPNIFTASCGLSKGVTNLKDFSLDKELHQNYAITVPGQYRVTLKFQYRNKTLYGFQLVGLLESLENPLFLG